MCFEFAFGVCLGIIKIEPNGQGATRSIYCTHAYIYFPLTQRILHISTYYIHCTTYTHTGTYCYYLGLILFKYLLLICARAESRIRGMRAYTVVRLVCGVL